MAGGGKYMTPFSCFIPGMPLAQGRPRFARKGKFVVAYDPKESRAYKKYAAGVIQLVMREKSQRPFTETVQVDLLFIFPRPKGKKYQAQDFKVSKPDLDNLIKMSLDAGTVAGLWQDDNIIAKLSAEKRYTDDPASVGVAVKVQELNNMVEPLSTNTLKTNGKAV